MLSALYINLIFFRKLFGFCYGFVPLFSRFGTSKTAILILNPIYTKNPSTIYYIVYHVVYIFPNCFQPIIHADIFIKIKYLLKRQRNCSEWFLAKPTN